MFRCARRSSDLVDIDRPRTAAQIHRAESPRLNLILDQQIRGAADGPLHGYGIARERVNRSYR